MLIVRDDGYDRSFSSKWEPKGPYKDIEIHKRGFDIYSSVRKRGLDLYITMLEGAELQLLFNKLIVDWEWRREYYK